MNDLANEHAEILADLLMQRRSVRGFKAKPVPLELLERVFAMAQLAPSNCNVQPWNVHVVSGAAIGRLREALYDVAASGREPVPDFPLTGPFQGVFRERQIASAKALFEATGVAREDRDGRIKSMLRNFRFFDAPHAAFILVPDWAGYREVLDCGLYAQSLMLSLTASGLASCPQASLGHHADVVRKELGLGEDMRVLLGIAFGFENEGHPANRVRTDRAEIAAAVTFHD